MKENLFARLFGSSEGKATQEVRNKEVYDSMLELCEKCNDARKKAEAAGLTSLVNDLIILEEKLSFLLCMSLRATKGGDR